MMKRKGRQSTLIPYERLLCSLLALIMTVSVIARPTVRAEAESVSVIKLDSKRMAAEELPEGNFVYIGTPSATLDESDGCYAFPVYRAGDLSVSIRVELHTVDMTAVYGKDYRLEIEVAEEHLGEKSVLETYMESVKAYGEGNSSRADINAEEEKSTLPLPVFKDGAPKSSLAQLKEEATGEPTRELYDTEGTDMLQSMVDYVTPDVMAGMDYSTATVLTFAPYEDVAWVTFRLMDDGISEGTESFSAVLTDSIGAEVCGTASLSVSITDNEPAVLSKISFADAVYSSEGNKVKLKVKREDAVYSLVDMRIYTCEDSARAGVNYKELDSTLAFMPYETEKEIELSVAGGGSFSVMLDGFTACSGGKHTTARVNIENGAPEVLTASGDTQSFGIRINGKDYTVEYVAGEATGKIMDNTSMQDPLEVGCYYFALPAEKGGYFHYSSSYYSGDKPNFLGTLDCEYVTADTQHNSYGDVAYYHSTTWKKGKIWAYSEVRMPGVYYQYIAADWQSTSSFGGGQKFRLNSTTLNLSTYADGKFDRNTENGIISLLSIGSTKNNKNFHVSVDAIDSSSYLTPKSYLRFYGVAAMYKRYNISVSDPEEKSYLTGNVINGVPETATFTPAQVTVKCGNQAEIGSGFSRDIYVNPVDSGTNLVFSIGDSRVNGTTGKFGVLKGYKIAVGSDSNQVTVSYPQDFLSYLDNNKLATNKCVLYTETAINSEKEKVLAHLDTVPYDAYFIDWIDSVQKSVQTYGHGYYQKLRFTPVFDYEKVTVEVLAPKGGVDAHFADGTLSKAGSYTFNAGDVLDLSVICNEADYSADGFEFSLNKGVTFDGPVRSSSYFQLLPAKTSGYVLRPAVALNYNRIELEFEDGAEDVFTVSGVNGQGLIDKELLKSDSTLSGKSLLCLNGGAATVVDMMRPTAGEVYGIAFLSAKNDGEYIYRPVITDKLTGKVYRTCLFNYTARNSAEDNVLRIGYERVALSELCKFTVSGTIVTNYAPIVSDGLGNRRIPVAGYTVALPGIQQTVEIKGTDENGNETVSTVTLVSSVTAITDSNGSFCAGSAASDSYVYGKEGDLVTMTVSNGSDVQVFDVLLGGTEKDGWANTVLEELSIVYPYDAPVFSYIKYSYQNLSNNNNTDSNQSSVKIFDDTITFEVGVSNRINSKLHYVSELRFGVYDAAGELTADFAVKNPDESLEGGVFSLTVPKMNQVFENGERLRVSIVERRSGTDKNGGEVFYDVVYPEVDTGYVFYVENLAQLPKSYDTPETTPVDIPIIGAASAGASSGLLSFSKTQWGKDSLGRMTGYTISVNADILAYNTSSFGTEEKLSKFGALRSAAKQADANLKEVDAYGKAIENTAYAALMNMQFSDGAESDRLNYESLERQKNLFYANESKLRDEAKQPLAGFTKAKAMRADVMFVLAFDFILDVHEDGTTEYVFCSGSVAVAGTLNYSQSIYSVIYGVPVFVNFTGTLQADMLVFYQTKEGEAKFTAGEFDEYTGNLSDRLTNTYATFGLTASLMAQAGVGMCNVLSARGYAKYGLQFSIPTEKVSERYGVLLMASGGIGFDLLFLSINFDIGNFKYGFGIYEKSTSISFFGGMLDATTRSAAASTKARVEGITATKSEYSSGTDDMSSFGNNGLIGAMPTEVSRSVLLEDAAERTRPKLVLLEDGSRMIFFIGNRGEGEGANSMALYYSVYRGGVWSKPEIVADDGTADTSPCVLYKDGKVYVAWADAERAYTDADSNIDKLNGLNISAAIYENGVMSREYSIVSDTFFNFAPQLNLIGDKLYCSYMKRDLGDVKKEDELLDLTAIYSTMAYTVLDTSTGSAEGEQFISIEHSVLTDPLVFDYNSLAAVVDGVDYMLATYTVDEDGRLATAEDRELFLTVTDVGIDLTFAPIRLTKDSAAQSTPKLTDIDGTVYLSWIENGSVFSIIDVSDMLHSLFNPTAPNGGVFLEGAAIGDADWYRKTASQLGMDTENYERTLYEELYEGSVSAEQVDLQRSERSSVSISDYSLATDGDDVYIFYTAAAGEDENDTGVELFGARYQRDMSDAAKEDSDIDDAEVFEKGGLGKSVQITDYGKVIDEFDLQMTENGDIYMVSNHFSQWTDGNGVVNYGKNELVEIKFSPSGSLGIKDGKVSLPRDLSAGHSEMLSFTVLNEGLLTAAGYDYTVCLVKGDEAEVIDSGTRLVRLEAGDSDRVDVAFTVPACTEDCAIEVTVTEREVAIPNPAKVSTALPYESRLSFSDTRLVWDGKECYAAATVSNLGNMDAEGFTAGIYATKDGKADKAYYTVPVSGLKSGESAELLLPFSPRVDDFNHLGYMEMQILLTDKGGRTLSVENALFTPCAPVCAEINGGKEEISLQLDTSLALSTKVGPWSSVAGDAQYLTDDPTVATVDENGTVYGKGVGTAEIKVYYPTAGICDTVKISVTEDAVTPESYGIQIRPCTGGRVSVDKDSPKAGDRVTITLTPDRGFTVLSVLIEDSNGKEIAVNENSDGTYSFIQPNSDVSISVVFAKTGNTTPPTGDSLHTLVWLISVVIAMLCWATPVLKNPRRKE
ncbi:MAG: Ig-like domain-containing protein [Clostridia bacterium]|nr:Ig-like domain-containing protein [Clostridia bacterium]